MTLRVGDVVKLKAGGEPMTVAQVVISCDGTNHDGAGIECVWFEGTELKRVWLSESSVEKM